MRSGAVSARRHPISRRPHFDLPSDRSTIIVDDGGENFIVSGVACCRSLRSDCQTALAATDRAGRHPCHARKSARPPRQTLACGRRGKMGAVDHPECQPYRCRGSAAMSWPGRRAGGQPERGESTDGHEPTCRQRPQRSLPKERGTVVIVTLGAEGCLVLGQRPATLTCVCRRRTSRCSTPAVPATCFAAVLAGGLAKRMQLRQRSKLALAAAAIAVTRQGTLSSCPTAAGNRGAHRSQWSSHDASPARPIGQSSGDALVQHFGRDQGGDRRRSPRAASRRAAL